MDSPVFLFLDQDDPHHDQQRPHPVNWRDDFMEKQPGRNNLHANDGQSLYHGLGYVQWQVLEQAGQGQHGDDTCQVAGDMPGNKTFRIRGQRRQLKARISKDVEDQVE